MATKLGKVATYCRKTPPTKSRDLLITWSRDKQEKTSICTFIIPLAAKVGTVVTYNRGRCPVVHVTF